ncbi:MAG: L,D-transpeptidase [Parvibaculaceae bacterium]
MQDFRRLSRRTMLLSGLATFAWPDPAPAEEELFPVRRVPDSAIDPAFRRAVIAAFPYPADKGPVVVNTQRRVLHVALKDGRAIRYGVAVGRAGEAWTGMAEVGRKIRWPAWTPTTAMLANQPGLSYTIEGGPGNPLGARALYLYQEGRDTRFRVHGACDPRLLGRSVSSGCIRMLDQDVIDLYDRVPLKARVTVL